MPKGAALGVGIEAASDRLDTWDPDALQDGTVVLVEGPDRHLEGRPRVDVVGDKGLLVVHA